ncbi:BA14K family protein [Bradyrhizobium sp. 62B]|uniref:BA14K family protein n=1 Tax=unclassified Bradyrhizobium TaxID=2631580 RepID=UPI001B8A3919|nr:MULTISPECIES: BA14K family protein [Bradyrhizobium]WIW43343.1 BA14K family protein [Bradyrhizobium sp. 62B]MBR0701084.1 BA14K family protein [Bradyrhizobium diazoefficiens]MBR0769509.1 BA14K family protein [Bradyrhizobium diazoefficiens]MBR0927460.1 BA14K family protein [Bradyrhizobium diazoefficiens]MDT4741217.1 BA14K family protein [Bradyrhizobium sp. WYCCWR 12699]
MNSLRVLSAAATLALVLPMSSPSFAQSPGPRSVGGISAGGGGGGGAHFGGGGGARMGGGAAIHGGGGNFAAGPAARPSGGNFIASPGPRTAVSPSFGGSRSVATAGNWQGGSNWSGRHWHHRHGGGFWPGFAAGAAIGGVGSYAYYGGGYYDDPYYYGDSYYDEPSVAVVPDSGGDSSAYCAQRYKSYDPASGTYLGYDGQRHPCP